MRHSTTVWNEKGITQGRTNNRLSKAGILLSEQAANAFKDVKIDMIICSPLMRTVQTANIMNKYHKVKVIKDENLIEIDQGIFTGRSKNDLTEKEEEIKARRLKQAKMESYEDCYNRIKLFVKNLKAKYQYENVLIVTHWCCASFIDDIINNKKVDFNNHILNKFKNAEIRKYRINL